MTTPTELPANVAQLIEKEAAENSNNLEELVSDPEAIFYEKGYVAGATAQALKSLEREKKLVEALEKIANSKSPANDGELDQWEMTARNEANEALKQYNSNI